MVRVLLVEDDLQLADVLSRWLRENGYDADTVHNGGDAIRLIHSREYGVLIFDWELPDIQGIEICRQLREEGFKTPVLFLTGKTETDSKITGLESGADDYLCKPFDLKELQARIRALLRRPHEFLPQEMQISGVVLNSSTRKVRVDGRDVDLTKRECGLLEYLMRHPDQFYRANELLNNIWPLDSAFGDSTVRVYIHSLRKKLASSDGRCAIKTSKANGYKFDSKAFE
jgi:DNA-binding response OmpR family regulator